MADYKVKYIRSSIVKKELFVHKEGKNKIKIRISAGAMDKVMEYLDNKVEEGVNELIEKLPQKTKGEHKGELKRITILETDFD